MSWTTETVIQPITKPTTDNCIEANATQALVPVPEETGSLLTTPRGRFQKEISGNPNGRPKGSRNRLTDQVLKSIADDFAQHGAEVLERVRREEPATYLKMIVSLLPRELVLQYENFRPSEAGTLDDGELMELANCDDKQRLAQQIYHNKPPIIRRRR